MLIDPHKSLDNYHLLPNESMESVDRDICKQITHLHFAGRYGFSLDLIELEVYPFIDTFNDKKTPTFKCNVVNLYKG